MLSARAGTPIAEIEQLVAESGQELAFEPMDYGAAPRRRARARARIGGVLAANLSGPRRIKAGAARDHFLGFTAVSGRGETFKSGGRVVKNVTGYDLCKLLAGSCGTLAAMTDVTIKTLPRAETEATLLIAGLDDAQAPRGDGAGDGLVLRCVRRGASAGGMWPARFAAPASDAGRDGVAARRRRAVGRAPHATCSRDCCSRSARSPIDREAESRARSGARSATCMPFAARRSPTGRSGGSRPRPMQGASSPRSSSAAGRADVLRLGRRPDLDRAAASDDAGSAVHPPAPSRRPAGMRR